MSGKRKRTPNSALEEFVVDDSIFDEFENTDSDQDENVASSSKGNNTTISYT